MTEFWIGMLIGAAIMGAINSVARRYAIVTARLQTCTFILINTDCAASSDCVLRALNQLEGIGANETGKRFIEDLPRKVKL